MDDEACENGRNLGKVIDVHSLRLTVFVLRCNVISGITSMSLFGNGACTT